jgi:hypothetical protein
MLQGSNFSSGLLKMNDQGRSLTCVRHEGKCEPIWAPPRHDSLAGNMPEQSHELTSPRGYDSLLVKEQIQLPKNARKHLPEGL